MQILEKVIVDKLSKIAIGEIEEQLLKINSMDLKYRDKINLPKFVTFGIEVEFEDANTESVKHRLDIDFPDWQFDRDLSVITNDINGNSLGGEVISPILQDSLTTWKEITKVCNLLKRSGACITDFAGGHIHFGVQTLGYKKEYWLNLIKLWAVYEPIICRFSFGEKVVPRAGFDKYAKQLDKYFLNNMYVFENAVNLYEILSYLPKDKYYSLNTCYVEPNKKGITKDNTIEVRCPNGTINPIIWQNNINFFAKLFLYCSSDNFDKDFIDYKLTCLRNNLINYDYSNIYIDAILEFSNLIFSNEIDKLYFLKQYLKRFDTIKDKEDTKKVYKL